MGWNPSQVGGVCTGRKSHAAAPDPCGWLPTGQPHVVYTAPIFAGDQR